MANSQRYLVTARKYRPKLFREVVAQGHVTDTLKNALRLDRLAHAYLFSGPRGVGKTTTARILAKAINCETPREEREDASEPCCACDSCRSFEEGRSLNVFEMDAASNNKVDDIRELRETVRIPPQGSTKKVYILDEVHMLSTAAFNALLKTLEEPPPHALFIFATTEPHKVLPTILSRCQRFDFRRIPVPNIVEHLREICEVEGIDADEESLMLLARKGDGALRDALSAFDQAISLCGTTIEYGELTQALGVVDQDLYFQLTDHIRAQSTAGVLKLVHHIVRSGYDLNEFLAGVAEHLRNLLVAQSLGGDALDDVAESTRGRYVSDSEPFSEADLLRLLMITGEAEEDIKNTSQPRLKLEMSLLKMTSITRSADLRTMLDKIDRLERMVDAGEIPDLPLGDEQAPSNDGRSPEPTTTGSAKTESTKTESAKTGSTKTESKAAESPPARSTKTVDASRPSGSSTPARAEPRPGAEEATEAVPETGADSAPSDGPHAASGMGTEAAEDAAQDSVHPTEDADPGNADTNNAESSDAEPSDAEPSDAEPSDAESAEEASDDPASDRGGDSSGGTPVAGGTGDGTSDDGGSGEVGYDDLFGRPALKKSGGEDSGASGPENRAVSTATATRPDAPAAADGSDGPGRATSGDGALGQHVAEPDASGSEPDDDPTSDVVHDMDRIWPEFIQVVKADRISIGTQLGETHPVGFSNGTAEIRVPDTLTRDRLRDKHRYLVDRLTDEWDFGVEALRFVVREASDDPDPSDDDAPPMPLDPREALGQLRERYPAVDTLVKEFGAEPAF